MSAYPKHNIDSLAPHLNDEGSNDGTTTKRYNLCRTRMRLKHLYLKVQCTMRSFCK